MTAGIYIHYPFCLKKCNYCDFTSFVSICSKDDLIEKVRQEISVRSQNKFKNYTFDTIFLGGGTPSLIEPKHFDGIFQTLFHESGLEFTNKLEITLEANPETVNQERVTQWIKHGINRISMGAQSSEDQVLSMSGRIHKEQKIINSYQILRDFGIQNINLDFILGLPGETDQTIQKNLELISDLNPEHLSIYFLTINEHTKLFEQISRGEINLPGEEKVVSRWQTYIKTLPDMGYEHYEISNFAKPEKQCKHNLHYWHRDPYLGLGVSAVGFDGVVRYTNPKSLSSYQEVDFVNFPSESKEVLDQRQIHQERIMLGLRLLQEGISINLIEQEKRNKLNQWVEQKYIRQTSNQLFLTEQGLIFSNQVISSLF